MAEAVMDKMVVNGVEVTVSYANESDARVSEKEVQAYIARAHEKYHGARLNSLKLDVDGEEVGVSYDLDPVPFDRIRRITGYLVGTLDRFNDAKRAEERDRVKHSL